MTPEGVVKPRVQAVARAAAVEALEADIEPARVVLRHVESARAANGQLQNTYNRVEALRAVLSVNRLSRSRGREACKQLGQPSQPSQHQGRAAGQRANVPADSR